MVTLARPKPIIAQTYPRTYTRGIQLFESDVYTPIPHHRESASANIRTEGNRRAQTILSVGRGARRGVSDLFPAPFNFAICANK
jgi:hypothetical protein